MPSSGKGPQVTAGQKGPKEPIRSPKNNPARSPGETESDGDRPRRFHACFPWESPRPCFLPAVRVALVPLSCVKGTRRSCEPGGRPGAIFGKEFGSPFSKSAREVPGPFPDPLRGSPHAPWQRCWQRPAPLRPRVCSSKEKRLQKNSSAKFCLPKPQERRLRPAPAEARTLCQPDLLVLP